MEYVFQDNGIVVVFQDLGIEVITKDDGIEFITQDYKETLSQKKEAKVLGI